MKNVVTLTKKEYLELVNAKRRLALKGEAILSKPKKEFSDAAFGILKRSFGREKSSSYVAKMRASWRG